MTGTSLCIICLIGLPGSGKSTLARNIEKRLNYKYNIDVICFDKEIVWNADDSWKCKRNNVYKLVENRIIKYLTDTNNQTLIILDDNMYYKSMRHEYYQLAKQFNIGFCQIYLNSPLPLCLECNLQRDNPVHDNIVIKMSKKLEIPDPLTNIWEKNSLNVEQNLNEHDWQNIDKLIEYSRLNPIILIETSKVSTASRLNSQKAIHLADIALRKLVGIYICKETKISKTFGLELSNKRQKLLSSIRDGEIHLPEFNNVQDNIPTYIDYLRPYFLKLIEHN